MREQHIVRRSRSCRTSSWVIVSFTAPMKGHHGDARSDLHRARVKHAEDGEWCSDSAVLGWRVKGWSARATTITAVTTVIFIFLPKTWCTVRRARTWETRQVAAAVATTWPRVAADTRAAPARTAISRVQVFLSDDRFSHARPSVVDSSRSITHNAAPPAARLSPSVRQFADSIRSAADKRRGRTTLQYTPCTSVRPRRSNFVPNFSSTNNRYQRNPAYSIIILRPDNTRWQCPFTRDISRVHIAMIGLCGFFFLRTSPKTISSTFSFHDF